MGVPTLPQVAQRGSHPTNTICFEGSDPRALSCFGVTLGTRLGSLSKAFELQEPSFTSQRHTRKWA